MATEMVEPSVAKICVSLAAGENPWESVLDALLKVVNIHAQLTLDHA
jgi:nitrate reductase assembly molybdenum cofactor insertion protein NarJ